MKLSSDALVESLRRFAGRPRIEPLTALLLRARLVRPAPLFVLREALRRPVTRVYRLRGSGLKVVIRHRTGDVVTLGEVFHEPDYRPPAEVQAALGGVDRVLDLGANVGLFGAFAAARWPGARITAFEPDPANAEVHERVIHLNGLESRWALVRAAAGNYDGRAAFHPGGVALSHLADGGQDSSGERDGTAPAGRTIEVPVVDVMAQIADADVVKIDIEGGEWMLLEDPRFAGSPPGALVFEYHPRFCPGGDPRERAESLLAAAGLSARAIWHRSDGHGMLWAWRS